MVQDSSSTHLLTDALAKRSRSLTPNLHHNDHPDLIVRGRYPRVASGKA